MSKEKMERHLRSLGVVGRGALLAGKLALPLENLLESLKVGKSIEEFLEEYTSAKRSQVIAVIEILRLQMDSGKARRTTRLKSLLKRLVFAIKLGELHECILDARIVGGVLRVISPSFDQLKVPLAKIPAFKDSDAPEIQDFKIDEDGSFIFWPRLGVHLGWLQLQQLVDPEAALAAAKENSKFNQRHGKAVKKVREQAGLKPTDIAGISEERLCRIEAGEWHVASVVPRRLSRKRRTRIRCKAA